MGRWLLRSAALILTGFALLATTGAVQQLARPHGSGDWMILGLALVAVSSMALALACWRLDR